MALTTPQKIALYQILEIPWQPIATRLIDEDRQVGLQLTIEATSTRQAKSMLEGYLTTYVDTDADVLATLQTLLNRWITLGTDVTRIEAGSTGSIGGVTNMPTEERKEIADQVRIIVPFYRKHDDLSRQAGRSGPAQIMR
jgi:hypothetical protein